MEYHRCTSCGWEMAVAQDSPIIATHKCPKTGDDNLKSRFVVIENETIVVKENSSD